MDNLVQLQILAELKKFNLSLENLDTAITDVVDRMDNRAEKSLLDLYEILLRFRCLEEYLGIEYVNPKKQKGERYMKRKKS